MDQILDHVDEAPVRVVNEDQFVGHVSMDAEFILKLTLNGDVDGIKPPTSPFSPLFIDCNVLAANKVLGWVMEVG